MKKMKTWMMMLIMIMTAGIMTSCEEDRKLGFRLDGEWRGDFGMNYTIEYRGQLYTYDSYDTYLVFYNDGIASSHGWGKQVDYYDYGPYEYQYYRFNWYIRDGRIHITYPRNPELEVTIYNYRMSYSHFYGTFGTSNISFDLRKLTGDYDWDYYYSDYSYGTRYDWNYGYYGGNYPYYSKTRATDKTTDSVAVKNGKKTDEEFRIVKVGNRFTESQKKDDKK